MTEEEKRYWKERDFFITLVDEIPYYVFWKNRDSVFLGCNQLFAKATGLMSPDEIIGKTDYELPWDRKESDRYRADDRRVMESGVPRLNIEEPQTLPDGTYKTLLTSKVPLISQKGKVIGVLCIYNDITERKTIELALQTAKEKAVVANQLKIDFIENMQHDMRTPAAGLYQILSILSETKNHKKITELLPIATKASKELLDLCNEIINFEKIDYGKHKIISKKLRIDKMVSRILSLNGAAAISKNIKFIWYFDPKIPKYVIGDSFRLRKILINLIGNSLKFTKKGEVRIDIAKVRTIKKTIWINFEISDTGIGIPENKIAIIFEKFTRLNPSNQNLYKGTGLGLSYVKKFVDDLNGKIKVESKVGLGTKFTITLPFALEKIKPSNKNRVVTKKSFLHPITNCQDTNTHILLIEDDVLAQFAAQNFFKAINYPLTIAKNVADALKMLNHTKFQLVISDIGLPDGSGIDIINTVRNSSDSPNYKTPFVALTAHTSEEKYHQVIESGFVNIIQKPLTQDIAQSIIVSLTDHEGKRFEAHDINSYKKVINKEEKIAFSMLELLAKSIQKDLNSEKKAFKQNDIT